jgi:hypothetical protein
VADEKSLENPKYAEMRDLLDYLASAHPDWGAAQAALFIARICCPEKLRRRFRL